MLAAAGGFPWFRIVAKEEFILSPRIVMDYIALRALGFMEETMRRALYG